MKTPTFVSRLARLAVALLFCISSAAWAETDWRNVAIGGGGFVSGIVFHPSTPDLAYVRTDVGGVYRWNPSGASWIPVNDDLGKSNSQWMGVLSIALDPHDSNQLYLACGQYLASWAQNAAILRSSDRGATWSRTTLSVKLGGNADGRGTGERLQVDPNKGSILFLGTNQDGLWRSADSGVTWSKVSSFSGSSINFVLFDPRSGGGGNASSTLYVAVNTTTGPTLFRTADGGATWNPVSGQPSGFMAYQAVMDKNGVYYGTFTNGLGPNGITAGEVWKLQTDSTTWTKLVPPAGSGGYAGISLDAQKPGTLVVSTLDRWSTGDEIFRSTDGGATWKAILKNGPHDTSLAPWAAGVTPHWMADVEIDPFHSDRVVFVTGFGLWESTNATAADAGQLVTWSFLNRGLEEVVPQKLISPPTGAPLVSVIGDYDGFRHDDLNVAPSKRHTPTMGTTGSLDFAELNPSIMARVGSAGQYSTNGASSWTAFPIAPPLGQGGGQIAVSADGSRFLWIPAKSGAYLSTNNGALWSASTGSPSSTTTSFTPVADRVNPSKFYIFDETAGKVYRSTDGGASFAVSAQNLPAASAELRAVPGLEGNLWLQSAGNGLYRSTDSGGSFTKLTSLQDAYRLGFGRAAPGATHAAVYIWGRVNGVDGLYRSDDTGASWVRINDDQHQFGWINTITGDARTYGRVYLGTGGRGIVYGDTASLAPSITVQPSNQAAVAGSTVTFSVTASSATAYQWYKDGVALAGATGSTLSLNNVQTEQVGTYYVVLTGAGGTTTSATVTLTLVSAETQKLTNISTRSFVGTGSNILIAGFIISGPQAKQVLIRGNGPSLAPFNVGVYLTDPTLTLFDVAGQKVGESDDWAQNNPDLIEATAARVGAFAWTRGSKDAALVITLPPGAYTAHLGGKNGAQGIGLVELYEADVAPTAAKLINISSRAYVKSGGEIMIGGFIIGGQAPKRVLIRAWGPALAPAPFNVPGVLPDPVLKLFRGDVVINQNDDWASDATTEKAFSDTGAYAWPRGSKDAALIVTLDPGAYTAQVSGKGVDQGVSLVEVFDYP